MDDLWQQFHRLPKAIRDAVARPDALAAVDKLEALYPRLDLASFVMRVVVKEFPIGEISARLVSESKLTEADAKKVADELMATVFFGVQDFLGVVAAPAPATPVKTPTPRLPTPPINLPMAEPIPPPSRPPVVNKLIASVPPRPPTPRPPAPATPVSPALSVSMSAPQAPVGPVAPTQAYSDDDAAEIAQQARRLQDLAAPVAVSLDDIAQQIITQHHLAFHEELLAKRAVAILKARLKDIRDKEETLMMLVRGPKVGGLGLDQDLAQAVVNSLEQQAGTVKARGLIRSPEPMAPPPPPAIPPLSAKKPEPKPPLFHDAATAPVRPGLPPLPNAPAAPVTPTPAPGLPIKRPADIPRPATMPPLTPTPVPSPPPPKKPAPLMTGARTIERPAVADITRPTKMLGPAEEMRTLTLIEFRRLGQGANESTARLLAKFKELQDESYTIWAEALAGWRQSEVYQVYLTMGRQSMEQATGISEVIKQRAAANQLYLSEHEFDALADLNRQLQP